MQGTEQEGTYRIGIPHAKTGSGYHGRRPSSFYGGPLRLTEALFVWQGGAQPTQLRQAKKTCRFGVPHFASDLTCSDAEPMTAAEGRKLNDNIEALRKQLAVDRADRARPAAVDKVESYDDSDGSMGLGARALAGRSRSPLPRATLILPPPARRRVHVTRPPLKSRAHSGPRRSSR